MLEVFLCMAHVSVAEGIHYHDLLSRWVYAGDSGLHSISSFLLRY